MFTITEKMQNYWNGENEPKATPADIKKIETELSIILAIPYIEFISQYGFVCFEDFDSFDYSIPFPERQEIHQGNISFLNELDRIMMVYHNLTWGDAEEGLPAFPKNFLPVGNDAGQGQILLKMDGEDAGSVWYWSENKWVWGTETNTWLGFVAKDFYKFINKLRPYENKFINKLLPCGNDKRTGISQNFYNDTKVVQEWENSKLKWQEWNGNGQKKKENNYEDGVQEGQQYEWHENGQLKLEENFANGIREGESSEYLENGLLKRKEKYQKGKIEGVAYKLWAYSDGIYSKTEYENNIPHGKEIVYYFNGTIMREGINQNGKEQGERIWWNTNKSIAIKEYYKNGKLDGERFIYDEQGKLECVQKYSDGERV